MSPSSLGRAGCFQYFKSLDIGGGGKEHHGNGFMELYVVHNFRDAGLFGATLSFIPQTSQCLAAYQTI